METGLLFLSTVVMAGVLVVFVTWLLSSVVIICFGIAYGWFRAHTETRTRRDAK